MEEEDLDTEHCIECGAEFSVIAHNEEVVDLLPTHCPYCGAELPQYEEYDDEYGDDE